MFKKTALILVLAILMTPLYPSSGMCWRSHSSGYYHQSNYYRGYRGDDAWLWGLTGLILGAVIVAATIQQPPPRRVVYVEGPQTPIYAYPPEVPPGMCRWERYILDDYGRVILDQYGQPVKQYTLGSCQYPPN